MKVAVVAHSGKTFGGGLLELRPVLDVEVKLGRKVLYELDGGDRTRIKAFTVEVEPSALSVCVAHDAGVKEMRQ